MYRLPAPYNSYSRLAELTKGQGLTKKLFIGVDGGATKCTVRVEDDAGVLIGQATSGPANIRLSVAQAWESIQTALAHILPEDDKMVELHAGMGLAGCELPEAQRAFINHPHPFHSLHLVSDAHTACLGAHGGQDGAIIIIGTGMVGLKCEHGLVTAKVGGWGFPHDDSGSGAWLGLEAMKVALQTMDGRLPASKLASAVYAHFQHDLDRLVDWANIAHSTQFAELAPIVVGAAKESDAVAIQLMQDAAYEIERAIDTLALGKLPLCLIGGLAPSVEQYIRSELRERIHAAQASPEAGAILLARDMSAAL